MANIWLAFLTGLTTGGFSCFAVQGGLLTSALTESNKKAGLIAFLSAKVIVYTILGFMLGFLGSSLNISPVFQGYLQIFIGLFMIATAARLLDTHPIFRYFVITPPKKIMRLLRNKSQAKTIYTPAILGALTVFIPCGVTQAMMILALGSGNPFWGALIMFAFTLGTTPVFFAIGLAASEALRHKAFNIIAALVIFVIGLMSVNSGQILRGSVHTFQNYWAVLTNKTSIEKVGNVVNIQVSNGGYKADVNTLKVGVPVKLKLTTNGVRSCSRAFTIPEFNYFKVLPETGTEEIEFTPTKTGKLTYTCSMGMYTGSFNVIP